MVAVGAREHSFLVSRSGIEAEGRTTMGTTATATLSNRDRAVLRAVAAGRCRISRSDGCLVIDGLCFCDQFAGPRLTSAGLITAAGSGTAQLTPSGQALLLAA
jgi:hypothetical protein